MRVEVTAENVTFIGDEGQVVVYPVPEGAEEVFPEFGRMPLSFVDGAYRVRDVPAGITYEFSVIAEDGVVDLDVIRPAATGEAAELVAESSLAGLTDSVIAVGLTAVVHHSGHRIWVRYGSRTGMPSLIEHSGGARVEVSSDPGLRRITGLSVQQGRSVAVPVVSYEYDSRGRLVGVRNSSGVPFRYDYDDAGRMLSLVDREGIGYFYRYDRAGRVVAAVGSNGMLANAFVYLADHGTDAPVGGAAAVMIETATDLALDEGDTRITERLDRLEALAIVGALRIGGATAGGLVDGGRMGSADREAPVAWCEQQDLDSGMLQDSLLGEVRPWMYRYTEAGDVWRVVSPQGAVTDFERDQSHALVRWVRADGSEFGFEYDRYGCTVATRLPDGTTEYTEFGGLGIPAKVVDRAGRETLIESDALGNVVSVTDPAGQVTAYAWDVRASGSVLSSTTDPTGAVTEVDCDDAGRAVRVLKPGGRVWSVERNVFGDIVSSMDPSGIETQRRFSPEGWLLSEEFGDGTNRRYTYNREGRQTSVVDEAGHLTTVKYVAYGHVAERTDAAGGVLRQRFDSVFDPVEVTSPDGLSWTFTYDRDSRVIGEVDYNGARTVYELDGVGRAVGTVDALGRRIERVFDIAGRLVEEVAGEDGRTEFRYDLSGALIEATNRDARVQFERDVLGRVVAETVNGKTVRSSFDRAGRRVTQRCSGGPDDPVTGAGTLYQFDRAGELIGLEAIGPGGGGASGRRFEFAYDGSGRETGRRLGGLEIASRWDARSRLAAQRAVVGAGAGRADSSGGGGQVVAGREWSYRADGYVAAVDDRLRGARGFSLDELGRVTAVTAGGVSATASARRELESYSYTPSGLLRSAASGGGVEGVASSPTAGPARVDASEAVAAAGTLVTRAGRERYHYDAAGQMVSRTRARLSRKPEVTRFTYTAHGQIRTVSAADGTVWTYSYDPFRRRVGKVHRDRHGVLLDTVDYVWDGPDLIGQTNTAHTPRGGLAAGARSTWLFTYHPGTGTPLAQSVVHHSPEGPVSATPGGPPVGWSQERVDAEFYAIVADLAGAPTELLDPERGLAGRSTSTLWGSTSWVGASTELRFAGQQYDPETGLHYNRHRYYNPVTSSYTSSDPLGIGPNPNAATAYVHNPHTWVDPLGLECDGLNNHGNRPVNAKGEPYPEVHHPSTGKEMPFPEGPLNRVPKEDRVPPLTSLDLSRG